MALFRFHMRTPSGTEDDDVGLDCTDLEAAYFEACRSIPPIAAELMDEGVDPIACTFLIANAAGETLMEVPFDERLRQSRRPPPLPHGGRDRVGSAARLVESMRRDVLAMAADARAAREAVRRSRALLRGDAID